MISGVTIVLYIVGLITVLYSMYNLTTQAYIYVQIEDKAKAIYAVLVFIGLGVMIVLATIGLGTVI